MRPWKMMLGLGVACAACCAIPLLGAAGGLAVFASALWACADEFPAAIVLGAMAAAFVGLWWWQRRRAVRSSSCGCATSCSTGVTHANS
jgi:hypothetical protein